MDHVEDIFAQLHEPKLDILDISAAYVMKQQHPGKTTSLDTVSIASSSSSSVGSVPLSDAEQRARNRLIVKRCYYKKINTLNELRAQVEAYEAEYAALLNKRHAQDARPTRPHETAQAARRSRKYAVHDKYTQLALVKHALRKENDELRRVHTQYLAMEKQMGQLYTAESKSIAAMAQSQEQKRRNPAITIHPLTLRECHAIAARAYKEVQAFRESDSNFSTGMTFFGWRDRHKLEKDRFLFSLEKIFTDRSVEEISMGTWEILSTPHLLEKVYSTNFEVHFEIVQQIDADNVVYYHTLERGNEDMRIRALILVSRIPQADGRGNFLLMRGLDPKQYLRSQGEQGTRDRRGRTKLEPQKEDTWLDTFIWSEFSATGSHGQDCRDDFGGIIPGTPLLAASWWMLEMLMISMRCEAHVIGPQILLQQ